MKFLYFESKNGEKFTDALFPCYQLCEEFDDTEAVMQIKDGKLEFVIKNMKEPKDYTISDSFDDLAYSCEYEFNEFLKKNGSGIIKNIEGTYEYVGFKRIGTDEELYLIAEENSEIAKMLNGARNKNLLSIMSQKLSNME